MSNLAQAFQYASVSEIDRFSMLVGHVVDNNVGVSALDLSADFNEFLRDKDPRGPICEDFMEFINYRGYSLEQEQQYAYAA